MPFFKRSCYTNSIISTVKIICKFKLIVYIHILFIQSSFCQNYFELPVKSHNHDTSYCSNNRDNFVFDVNNNYNNFGNHPCDKPNLHSGKDIAAIFKTPVSACGDGSVFWVEDKTHSNDRGFGRTVILKHNLKGGGIIYSQYSHLYKTTVSKGDLVYKGDKIGEVGNSGYGNEFYYCDSDKQNINDCLGHLHLEFKTHISESFKSAGKANHPCLITDLANPTTNVDCSGYFSYEVLFNPNAIVKDPDIYLRTSSLDSGIEYEPHNNGGGCNFQKMDFGGIEEILEVEPNDIFNLNLAEIINKPITLQPKLLRDQQLYLSGNLSNQVRYINVQGNFFPSGDFDIYSFFAGWTGSYGIALKHIEINVDLSIYKKQNGKIELVKGPIPIQGSVGSNNLTTNVFCQSGVTYYIEIKASSNQQQCNPYQLIVARIEKEICPPGSSITQSNQSLSRDRNLCLDCHDGIKNNTETGIDCGGEDCIACVCDVKIESSISVRNNQNNGYDFRGDIVSSSTATEYVIAAYIDNELVSYSQEYYKHGDRAYLGNIPCNKNVVIRALQVDSPSDCYAEILINTSNCEPFGPPNIQASEMRISYVNTDQFHGTWKRGNGQKVLLTCTPCNLSETEPKYGIEYGANNDYSQAPKIGNSRLIYIGTGNSSLITGLSPTTCYRLRAYEYNVKYHTFGKNVYYITANPATASATTSEVLSLNFDWKPNPIVTGQSVDFDWISSLGGLSTENWTFQSGTPSSNNTNGCCVTWNSPGTYRVTLEGWHASTDQRQTIFKDVTVVCNSTTFYIDNDNDGFGHSSNTIQACTAPTGYVSNNTDCTDTDATIYPNAPELCDGLDNNCDGYVDEGNVCLGECQDSWTITNSMTHIPSYRAVNQIKTLNTVLIESTQEVTLAADYIDINDGFNMQPGAFFEAKIDPCTLDGNLTTEPKKEEATLRTKEQETVDINIPCNNTFFISPNPFKGTATLNYKLQEATPTRISLYTLNGSLLKEVKPISWQESGEHTIPLDAAGMTKGVYICMMYTSTCRVTQTIIIQ